jgi:hypothetical protein
MPVEARIAGLLRKIAALEEAIIRLETGGQDTQDTVRRLMFLQGEMLAALALLDHKARRRDFFAGD